MADRPLSELRAEALDLLGQELCPNALKVVRQCLRALDAMDRLAAIDRAFRPEHCEPLVGLPVLAHAGPTRDYFAANGLSHVDNEGNEIPIDERSLT